MNSPEYGSPFEEQLQALEQSLDANFKPKIGSNLRENLGILRHLFSLTKLNLEVLLSRATLISLNDEEYERVRLKISDLITENEAAAREMGLDPSKI